MLPRVAEALARLAVERGIPVCFKSSFDKANRARLGGARGPGLEEGLRVARAGRAASGLPILTDIHEPPRPPRPPRWWTCCRSPPFSAARPISSSPRDAPGKPVNMKKGQWLQPEAMAGAVEKVRAAGRRDLAVTERGTFFGYGDLVVDMRNFARLRRRPGAR